LVKKRKCTWLQREGLILDLRSAYKKNGRMQLVILDSRRNSAYIKKQARWKCDGLSIIVIENKGRRHCIIWTAAVYINKI